MPGLNLKTAKQEGMTGLCPNCNRPLKCTMSNYGGNYPDKLQWQNAADGSAHLKFNAGTKTFSCMPPKDEQDQQPAPAGQGTLNNQQSPPPAQNQQQTAPPPQQAPPAASTNTIGRKDLTAEQITVILDKVDYWKQVEGLICGRLSIDAMARPSRYRPQKSECI